MKRTPLPAASVMALRTFSKVPPAWSRTGAICAAATRTILFSFSLIDLLPSFGSERPGVEGEGIVLAVEQDEVEHVLRRDRRDAGDQRRLAMAVECLQGEAAGIDHATLR